MSVVIHGYDSAEEANYFTQRRKDAKENAEPSSYSLLKIVVYVIKFSPILKIFAPLRLCVKLPPFSGESSLLITKYGMEMMEDKEQCPSG